MGSGFAMTRKVAIVGAGQAGAQVAASLRELGHRGGIVIVGDEPHPPYQRPPLSKAFLKEALGPERLYLKPLSFFAEREIELAAGKLVGRIDLRNRRLEATDGDGIDYDILVLATGTRSRLPAIEGGALANVFALRGIGDVETLRPAIASMRRIAIIGGGYIGLEVAAVLRGMGRDVVIVEAEDRILKRVTSPPVSEYFDRLHRANGVEIVTGARLQAITGDERATGIALGDGRNLAADAVLLAIGAIANSELAAAAGIDTGDGILVDAFGRTSVESVFACGDCARFPSRRYRRSVRIESVQNAIDQAKCVAAAIVGRPFAYDPVPWFWSDQYDTKLQIAGLSSSDAEFSVEGDPAGMSFAVEYRRDGRLVAVDAINNARAHMLSRRRIAEETADRDDAAPGPAADAGSDNHQWRASEHASHAAAMTAAGEAKPTGSLEGAPATVRKTSPSVNH